MVEMDHARAAGFIEPEVEALAVELRKHVVEERVEVGERDHRSRRDRDYVGVKALVMLADFKSGGRTGDRSLAGGGTGRGLQPQDRIGLIRLGRSGGAGTGNRDASGDRDRLGTDEACDPTDPRECDGLQNRMPAPKPM